MRSLSFAICLVVAGCSTVGTTDRIQEVANAQRWLEPFPGTSSRPSWEEIPASRFFEIPVSRLSLAEHALADAPYLANEGLDEYYDGRDFRCPPPARAYLVRAMFMYGGNGLYALHWAGSSLIVEHASLGVPRAQYRSALVACLTRAPAAVYSLVGTDS